MALYLPSFLTCLLSSFQAIPLVKNMKYPIAARERIYITDGENKSVACAEVTFDVIVRFNYNYPRVSPV